MTESGTSHEDCSLTSSSDMSQCDCVQDESRGWPKCPVHGKKYAKMLAFEHDFTRIVEIGRAAHAFYQSNMIEAADDYLVQVINLARGVRAALCICDHEWTLNDAGQPHCVKGCGIGS